jgi:hypothetical protein
MSENDKTFTFFYNTTVMNMNPCPYCAGQHDHLECGRVESIEYYESGAVKRIKLRERRDVHIDWTWPKASDETTAG